VHKSLRHCPKAHRSSATAQAVASQRHWHGKQNTGSSTAQDNPVSDAFILAQRANGRQYCGGPVAGDGGAVYSLRHSKRCVTFKLDHRPSPKGATGVLQALCRMTSASAQTGPVFNLIQALHQNHMAGWPDAASTTSARRRSLWRSRCCTLFHVSMMATQSLGCRRASRSGWHAGQVQRQQGFGGGRQL